MVPAILSGSYLTGQDNIDLSELLEKFYSNFKFHENHHFLKHNLKPLALHSILNIYNQQDYLASIAGWQECFSKSLRQVEADYRFSLVLKKIQKVQVPENKELIQTYTLIKAISEIYKDIKLPFCNEFDINHINKCFKNFFKDSELLFDFKSLDLVTYKHPKLKSIDKKITETTKELRVKLSKISSSWAKEEILQQNEYDVFDDKYVLPVRSDRYHGQLGRIIYRSNTGNTLFVEPFSLRELSNRAEEYRAELERETYKLLKFLTEELYQNEKLLSEIFSYILTVDLCAGRLRCAQKYHLNRPVLNEGRVFNIENIFHPLINDPVKNDIKIGPNHKGLLISGPNTGGKTVLLKSLCLCLVLPHLGFFVPASSADISYTDKIFFMSHDNQSLIDGLSSFSSEALNYIDIINRLTPRSVIFIDEIFNTTSSLEASELATALIKEVTHINAIPFISSHHENLKEIVFDENILESGHMGFLKGSSSPTYVLHMGSPGKSFAREVFLRIEKDKLDHPRISRWLGQVKVSKEIFDQKIEDLDNIRDSSMSLKLQFESDLKELSLEKERIENLLKIERSKLESEFDKKWQKLKKETYDLAENIKKGKVRNIVKISQTLNDAKEAIIEPTEVKILKGDAKSSFVVGETVILKTFNKQGRILKINKNKAQVSYGKLKTWVSFNDLLGSQQPPVSSGNTSQVHVHVSKRREARGMLFDARGIRRDPFINQAENYILDVINGDLPFVDIVHGHGDGVLKSALFDILNQFKDEVKYGHIEGNMGTTRVELAD